MNLIERKQLKNHIERVLHVPGNYQGGILEMAVVIDMSMTKEEAVLRAKELVSTLKSHSEVFRNVRLNTILWKGDEEFVKEVTPLALLQMGRFFDAYESAPCKKNWDGLFATLKKFYARSKLIIVLTDKSALNIENEEATLIPVENKAEAKENMQPFLHKKMFVVAYESGRKVDGESNQEDNGPIVMKTGTELFMSLVR